ncbi:OB-fold domain-containing protein [Agrobacterium sp. B1(2019)]|uniref:Zn-ribbon domain-containing OB-fold protein n=1 Tax=Agrobacterium sp. B1(2019) TaxID=2607032 RepID=UPI0011ED6650|nr:OB-fold domain-containing protein [Agrobacterium sp. B1(2019)]TZG34257.1 OB-fold domain-containing protein [Agrobacterium sp. B1(2019)]
MTSIEVAHRHEAGGRDDLVRLEASRDRETGKGVFPRLPATSPSVDRFEPITLSTEATLYSHTTIHPNPKMGKPPFTLVYADFPEDVRVFGRLHLRPGEKPVIGSKLHVHADGNPNTTYFFTVVEEGK